MTTLGKAAAGDVTLVEVIELLVPLEEFERIVGAAIRRLEVEGVRELVTMQFYADPASNEAGAIITFSERARMIDHMNMISGWAEFQAYARACRLADMRVYGVLPPEAEAWIRAFGSPSKRFGRHLVGFARR